MTEEFYRWLLQLIREDRLVKFYQSPKWLRLREKAMKRDHYECQECRRLGKYHRVENVHHIKEVKDRPDLALDLDNLINSLRFNSNDSIGEEEEIEMLAQDLITEPDFNAFFR